MEKSKAKKFKFFNAIGTVNIAPFDRPTYETEFGQPVEICFVGTDTDGTMVERMFKACDDPRQLPTYMIGRLLFQLFQLKGFKTNGATVVEIDQDDHDNDQIHIHTIGTVAPFDVDQWNHESELSAVLLECKIKTKS